MMAVAFLTILTGRMAKEVKMLRKGQIMIKNRKL
jgi:hypothetical protein